MAGLGPEEQMEFDPHTDYKFSIPSGPAPCSHLWQPHTQRQYWLKAGHGMGPGYAVHAEHHTEHKVMSVYCQHCLEVREM